MMSSYLKHQEQGNICYLFTTENRNLEIAKVENLKTEKFSPTQLRLAQFLGNKYPKIIRTFSKRQNTITRARKKLCRLGGILFS